MLNLAEILAQAVKYHQAGDVHQAMSLYRQVLEVEPNRADAWCYLGLALLALGHLDEAERCYRHAIALKPDYADAHSDLGIVLGQQGRLHESVASFQQAIQCKPNHAGYYNNLGVALAQVGRCEEAVQVHRYALQLSPNDAGAHNNLGLALLKLERLDEAASQLRRAITLKPDYADAYYNLALVMGRQNNFDEGIELLEQSLRLKPDNPDAYNDMGVMYARLDRFEDAETFHRKSLTQRPDHAETHYNLGLALHRQLKLDAAIASYENAISLKPDYADAHCDRAFALLVQGRFEQGWPEYEWRWNGRQKAARDFYQARWDGSPLAGRTILLHAEQGRGDTIQFIRYAPLVQQAGGRVVVECQQELASLIATCAGIDQLVIRHQPLPAFHVHAPLLSLPGIFRTNLDTIPAHVPYLAADPARIERWRQEIVQSEERTATKQASNADSLFSLPRSSFKIGIAWRGDPVHKGDRFRSVSLARFAPLANIPGVRLFSLQRGPGLEELGQVDFPLVELGSHFETFMDTAAVLMNLDLLITIDTAVAHCAGALGRPVWVMLPFVPDWRWLLEREDSPWYPGMRLFRQKRMGDWDEVFQQIEGELAAWAVPRSQPGAGMISP